MFNTLLPSKLFVSLHYQLFSSICGILNYISTILYLYKSPFLLRFYSFYFYYDR